MKYVFILFMVLFPWNKTLNITPSMTEDHSIYMGILNIDITVTAKKYSKEEIQAAELCACGEAEGEGLVGQIGVLNVVMNRMNNSKKTLLEVVYRKGQFHGMGSKRPITDSCKEAVRMVLFEDVRILPNDVEYFLNEKKVSPNSRWLKKLLPNKWGEIGRHTYFKKTRV